MIPVWDLLGYLGCLQILLILNLGSVTSTSGEQLCSNRTLFLLTSLSAAGFWLVWGGYSVDAWRYLSQFDLKVLHFHEEQIFWGAGSVLGSLVPDPWPLKIISGCSIFILCWAYFRHFGSTGTPELTAAYMLLLITPAFFLLYGNAVRQGFAASVGVLAITFFLQGSYFKWLMLAVAGFFIHQAAILVAVALLIASTLRNHLFWIWLGSLFVSPVVAYLFSLFGHELTDYIRYADYSEGVFHWAKVAMSTAISLVVLLSLRVQSSLTLDFRHAYIGLGILGNCLLIYEVPFERILLFSDLLAAPALAQILVRTDWLSRRYIIFSILVICGSILLWTHQSILRTLGYI